MKKIRIGIFLLGMCFLIKTPVVQAQAHQDCFILPSTLSCRAVTWRYQEKLPKPPRAPKKIVPPAPKGPVNAYSGVPANVKNPNSVRIPLSAAPPILSDTKTVNGKKVCKHGHDKPVKSKKNHKGKIHIDEQCCLDPDEIPNPRCYYPELGR
jgi:hypothetical protein